MTYDPNSTIPQHHEVRVTMRGVRITETGGRVQVSTRSDFIAPDLSAPATTAVEQTRGLAGWTIRENKPQIVGYEPKNPAHSASGRIGSGRGVTYDPRGHVDPQSLTVGTTVIRKPRKTENRRVLNGTGPAHRRTF